MNKKQAKYIFRGTANLAKALDITRQAIHQWPSELTQRQEDTVMGAALRLGIDTTLPEYIKNEQTN